MVFERTLRVSSSYLQSYQWLGVNHCGDFKDYRNPVLGASHYTKSSLSFYFCICFFYGFQTHLWPNLLCMEMKMMTVTPRQLIQVLSTIPTNQHKTFQCALSSLTHFLRTSQKVTHPIIAPSQARLTMEFLCDKLPKSKCILLI